jgi:beta-1,4-mannosyltransferase
VGSPTAIEFRFSQGALAAFDVDVVHVAEPKLDHLLGTRGASDFQRLIAALVLARNLRRHGIALVRTLHSSGKQRRPSRALRLATRVLDRATTTFVILDDSTRTPDVGRTTVITHPHFRERYVGYPRSEMVRGRILCVSAGEIPAEAQHLLPIPQVTNTENLSLRLAGMASRQLEESVRAAVARHAATVSARLERLSDGGQVQEICSAELVVLPTVETMSDLQLVFLALSLERPVLVPRTEAMTRLAAQVGPGWVQVSDRAITARVVDDAFVAIRSVERSGRPALDDRGLAATHAAYEVAFRAAAASVRRR